MLKSPRGGFAFFRACLVHRNRHSVARCIDALIDRLSLSTITVRSIRPIGRAFSAPQKSSIAVAVVSLIASLPIKCPQRLHHFVEADHTFASWHAPQSWRCLDRTRVRRPRRKDRALFVQRKIGIVNNFRWIFKRLRTDSPLSGANAAMYASPATFGWFPASVITAPP